MENSFPITEKLIIINTRKRDKEIPTYNFGTSYTTIPHNLLIKVLSEILHFGFKSNVRSDIGLPATSIYWTSKSLKIRYGKESY